MARILVVDDEVFMRLYLEEVLAEEGHEVLSAHDGADALRLLRGGGAPPDLILLDLMMPRMNGWEFRREQTADPALSSIPVIVVSGAGDVESEAERMGALAALTKPFLPDRLLAVIAEASD